MILDKSQVFIGILNFIFIQNVRVNKGKIQHLKHFRDMC